MLHNFGEQVSECLRHADDCAERAKRESAPDTRLEILEMENLWLKRACSYQLLEQLALFTTYNRNCAELSRRLARLDRLVHDYAPYVRRSPSK